MMAPYIFGVYPASGGGGAETHLFDVTITNPLNSTTTNQLARIPVLLGDGQFGSVEVLSTDTINIYDDDGSGGLGSRIANFDFHASCTDMNGRVRLGFLNGIIPSLAASGTSHRKLKVYKSSTALPTGTALTFANILDMDGIDSGGVVFECVIGGTTYSADLKTMLTAGSGAFSKTGAQAVIWDSGPCLVHFRGHMPVKNGGSSHASGDGLHVFMWGMAWKASSGPYNAVTNPIIGLEVWVKLENGGADRASPANYTLTTWSIKRMTSLSDATLITASDTDPDGNTLTYTGSSASAYYGGTWAYPVYIGQKPAIFAFGDHLTTGAKNTTDDQHGDYIRSTGLIPNYGRRYADVNHATGIATLNVSDSRLLFPGTAEITTDEFGTGPRNDIAVVYWGAYEGLAKWNADGRRRIFENARAQLSYHTQALRLYDTAPTNGELGVVPRWDNETGYSLNGAFSGGRSLINYPGTNASPWSLSQGDHTACAQYAAYLMSCNPIWLESMEAEVARFSASIDPTYLGLGGDMTVYGGVSWGGALPPEGNTFASIDSIQERAQAWILRTMWQLALCNPDANTSGELVGAKTAHAATWANNFIRAKAVIDANTGGTGKRWATNGPRWTQNGAPWQLYYALETLCSAGEAGMEDANLTSFIDWYAAHLDIVHQPTVAPYQYILAEYFPWYVDPADGTTQLKEWADYYQKNALLSRTLNYTGRKLPSGSWSMSDATVGTGRTLHAPSSAFAGGSWYVGGKVVTTVSDSDNTITGEGVITSVTDADDVVITISDAFPSATPAASALFIPGPHPDDAEATRTWIDNANVDYRELAISCVAMLKDRGRANAAADYAEMVTNWAPQGVNRNEVLPRAA